MKAKNKTGNPSNTQHLTLLYSTFLLNKELQRQSPTPEGMGL
jgi:hypothetical protein